MSANKSNINSTFQSVGQQSGLKAGDGGFQVSVNNNTDLKGAVIASTQSAVDNNKNSFTTGGALTISDIQNTASFRGTAVGVSVGVGSQLGASGAGVGNKSGNASSVSSAGISGIAGNTAVRTGDAETGLQRIFDADKVQKDINAQVAITTAFTQQVGSIVAKGVLTLLANMSTPAQAPTAANPNPAADKLVRSDQEMRAGFDALQSSPELDAPAKAFFADLANAYTSNTHMNTLVSDAKSDPTGYQQSEIGRAHV